LDQKLAVVIDGENACSCSAIFLCYCTVSSHRYTETQLLSVLTQSSRQTKVLTFLEKKTWMLVSMTLCRCYNLFIDRTLIKILPIRIFLIVNIFS